MVFDIENNKRKIEISCALFRYFALQLTKNVFNFFFFPLKLEKCDIICFILFSNKRNLLFGILKRSFHFVTQQKNTTQKLLIFYSIFKANVQ